MNFGKKKSYLKLQLANEPEKGTAGGALRARLF